MSAAAASSNPVAELGCRPTEANDLLVLLGGGYRLAIGRLVKPNGEDPPHARAPGRGHELAVSGLADAEMGVRIDHERSLGWRSYAARG